jgi:hypothetical protein
VGFVLPSAVHTDFAGRIWLAVQDRFGADEQDEWARYNLENWHRPVQWRWQGVGGVQRL